ncbi:MAG: hypothetical protein IJW32_00730 [Clostridia bacterium]|nr:hypothetical protein [Clostridia bacterium]
MIGVLLYLIFISVFLFVFKNKNNKQIFIKNKKRINNFVFTSNKFFINKNNIYSLYQTLKGGLVIFDRVEKYQEALKTFSFCGLDILLPVYKYECYQKELNVKEFYKTLKLVKKLDSSGVEFNFFVFYNNDKFFKTIAKLIKYFNFKKVKTRIYNSCQIDYKLLSFINLFNLNPQTHMLKVNTKNKREQLLNVLKNTYDIALKQMPSVQQQEGLFFYFNNQILKENEYVYSGFKKIENIEQNKIKININKTFNFKFLSNIYKIKITNTNNTMQSVYCCFGTVLKNKTLKNGIYLVNKNKNKITVIDSLQDKYLCLLGNFQKHFCQKNYFYAMHKLTIGANQEVEFCFMENNTNAQNNNALLSVKKDALQEVFEKTLQDYTKIKFPKILSQNKVLNYLINDFLPNKIIVDAIVEGRLTLDLDLFLNKKFDKNLIDKEVCNKNLKSYFLLNSNYFKVYFNLFYFYLGFWQREGGIYINQDKTFVLSSVNISTFNKLSPFNINVQNKNMQNEIELNSVKFTNLKSLDINSFVDKNLNLHF